LNLPPVATLRQIMRPQRLHDQDRDQSVGKLGPGKLNSVDGFVQRR